MEFEKLYDLALKTSKETLISKDVEVGSVGCALVTDKGNVYAGKNLDMSCSLGMCAERNAIGTMLTHEVAKIDKIVCVHKSGKVILPCGACREFMKQLEDLTKETKILVSLNPLVYKTLDELMNLWWRDSLKEN